MTSRCPPLTSQWRHGTRAELLVLVQTALCDDRGSRRLVPARQQCEGDDLKCRLEHDSELVDVAGEQVAQKEHQQHRTIATSERQMSTDPPWPECPPGNPRKYRDHGAQAPRENEDDLAELSDGLIAHAERQPPA